MWRFSQVGSSCYGAQDRPFLTSGIHEVAKIPWYQDTGKTREADSRFEYFDVKEAESIDEMMLDGGMKDPIVHPRYS